MLSAFAVLRLMTNRNLVDCWTGKISRLLTLEHAPGVDTEKADSPRRYWFHS
jgi:hypothetical protein